MNIIQALQCSKALDVGFTCSTYPGWIKWNEFRWKLSCEAILAEDWHPPIMHEEAVKTWLAENQGAVLYYPSSPEVLEEVTRLAEQGQIHVQAVPSVTITLPTDTALKEMLNLLRAVGKGFMVCSSFPSDKPRIEINFPSLKEAQLAHTLLIGLNADYTKTVAYKRQEELLREGS